jgi:hypothetical protein
VSLWYHYDPAFGVAIYMARWFVVFQVGHHRVEVFFRKP